MFLIPLGLLSLVLLATPGLANSPLTLRLTVQDHKVTASWQAPFPLSNYVLYYAPYPEMNPIQSVPLGELTRLSVELPYGAAYYVAVSGEDLYGQRHLSNITYFRIKKIWHPSPGTTWQWQLTDPIDLTVEAEMFDIDLFETPKEIIQALHQRGRIVICYFSAGTYEPWRPDAPLFPREIIGNPLKDWPEERWLDIRRLDLLAPLMEARLDLAVQKGCDGVEPDNVDAYQNKSGFPISDKDQLRYNRWLAQAAHQRGLSVGLKNDLDQIPELVDEFDWALNEECFSYEECEKLLPFIKAGKAVFGVEYELSREEFCPEANRMGFSFMKKHWELDAWQEPCW